MGTFLSPENRLRWGLFQIHGIPVCGIRIHGIPVVFEGRFPNNIRVLFPALFVSRYLYSQHYPSTSCSFQSKFQAFPVNQKSFVVSAVRCRKSRFSLNIDQVNEKDATPALTLIHDYIMEPSLGRHLCLWFLGLKFILFEQCVRASVCELQL